MVSCRYCFLPPETQSFVFDKKYLSHVSVHVKEYTSDPFAYIPYLRFKDSKVDIGGVCYYCTTCEFPSVSESRVFNSLFGFVHARDQAVEYFSKIYSYNRSFEGIITFVPRNNKKMSAGSKS